ncbi:hypothetical protein [Xanthomonas campestris]|uniref:hypothetical protein n=1 Tax=Xanthomonas campestris TaxID=339 RepID=UPI001C85F43F|nr:hypothetical protein [Xanthomonas campestris]MEB1632523.1 hypothetical protein [Xanthomonas campestris pv. campestris]WDJ35549.1 hypothetical protein JH256_04425 [Xanthomonas campestris pv. campestris]WDJ81875.1 hypothetical protein JH309_04425 [Xanthomonas campestris pv. campestris]
MHRVLPPHKAGGYRSAAGVRNMLTILLLITLLTASLVVLAYRTSIGGLMELAQCAAIIGAALHFAIVILLVVFVARALAVWRKLHAEGKQTSELKQLQRVIVSGTTMTLLMFLLAVIAACVPPLMKIMTQVPEFGVVFALMLVALLLHNVNINRICRLLTDAITAAQQAAQRTMAA